MLLVVHIPKTAGTSLRLALQQSFGLSRIARDYGPQSDFTTHAVRRHMYENPAKHSARDLVRELEGSGYAALVGHFPYSKYGKFFKGDRVIAFVREPLERACSEYVHRMNEKTIEGSIEDFIETPKFQNLQSRALMGAADQVFVGITENYRSSLGIINQRLDLSIKHRRDNPGFGGGGKRLRKRLDPAIVQHFYELNEEDVRLYETALNQFNQAKSAAPSILSRFGM